MISKEYKFAVVGASLNPSKYGNKVFNDLNESGYDVTPINPKGGQINGITVVKSLIEMDDKPDVIVTVVPPNITEGIISEAIKLGIKNVWMQPGSESEKAIKLCQENGISCIYNACIMVQRRGDGVIKM